MSRGQPRPGRGNPPRPTFRYLVFLLALLPLIIWIAALLMVVLGSALGLIHWGDRPSARS